jgi:hypothetical protein
MATTVTASRSSGVKSPKPTKGTASVVSFYTGDSALYELAQHLDVKLSNFVSGYGRSTLLIEESKSPKLFDSTALKKANEVREPTAANFIDAIKDLVEDSYSVDVFVIGHGTTKKMIVSKGFSPPDRYGNSWLDASEIGDRLDSKKMGLTTLPLRLVAQWICFGSTMNNTWSGLGAKCVFGARGIMYYPQQCDNFAKKWDDGESVKNAIDDALNDAARTLTQTFLQADALTHRKKWGGCPFGKTILGDHDCAKDYFKWKYGVSGSEWPSGLSGKEYMNYASTLLREGSTGITKNTKPDWDS